MGSAHSPDKIAWLMHSAAQEREMPVGLVMEVDDRSWRARFERCLIDDGLRVVLSSAEVRDTVTLEPQHGEAGEWVSTNVIVRGRLEMEIQNAKAELDTRRAAMYRTPDRRGRFFPALGALVTAGFMIRSERALRMLGGDAPPAMRRLLEGEGDDPILTIWATESMRRLAAGMFAERHTGSLRKLYLEGAVVQMLALMAIATARPEVGTALASKLSSRERMAVMEARARLLADMRAPPSLAALSESVGLGEKALNAGFRQLFGATIFEVLRNERLDHARLALEQSEVPIKVVADRVGYRHVSNFISAFTRRYGAPPARFLRERSTSTSQGSGAAGDRPALGKGNSGS